MSTITLRSTKGLPLTNTEVDNNFSNLNTDKLEFGGTYSTGTANGVAYLDGSKVLTSGSALTFDGTSLQAAAARGTYALKIYNSSDGSVAGNFGALTGNVFAIDATGPANTMTFLTGGSERMRLTSTGLGIGTSSPTNTLSVAGSANITGNTTLGDASTDRHTINGTVAFGSAAQSYYGIYLGLGTQITGDANPVGLYATPTFMSDVTGLARVFQSSPRTTAASFTVANAVGFYAADSSKGAGSTITNQHGLYIADQTQGTNNYGITSLVSSGTNKWNIYASGTAANYFAGNVGICTNSLATDAQLTISDIDAPHIFFQRSGAGKFDSAIGMPSSADLVFYNGATATSVSGLTERLRLGGTEAVFNDPGNDYDFRVESDTNTHALFVDAGNSRVGINRSNPGYALSVGGQLDAATSTTALPLLHLINTSDSGVSILLSNSVATSAATIAADVTSAGSGTDDIVLRFSSATNAVSKERLALGPTSTVFNEEGLDVDFRVESDTNTHALFVDAGNGRVGINQSSPSAPLDVKGDVIIKGVGSGASDLHSKLLFRRSDSTTDFASIGFPKDQANADFIIESGGNSNPLRLQTNGDEVKISTDNGATTGLQYLPTGYLRFASGTGGIQFNGDTASANALDDYEEGTFTPVITGSASNPTVTYATQQASYVKVGKVVTAAMRLLIATISGGSGYAKFSLPFTAASGNGWMGAVRIEGASGIITYNLVASETLGGQGECYLRANTNPTGAGADVQVSNLIANTRVYITLTYEVA